MTKTLHVGDAARGGLEAAKLASNGFTADQSILERDFGRFCDLFQRESGYDFTDPLESLGDPWPLLDPPVGFKPYPCCESTHSAIDAALELRDQYDLQLDQIESVIISEHPRRLDHTDKPAPETALAGKFSVQYTVSAALIEGNVWLNHFDDETVTAEPYRSFLENISVKSDRETFADREWRATVLVKTLNGEYSATVDDTTGSDEQPIIDDELETKYRHCATISLDEQAVDRPMTTLRGIESVDDVGKVIDKLV